MGSLLSKEPFVQLQTLAVGLDEVKELADKGQSFNVVIHVSAHPPLEETANGEVRVD